MATSWSSVYTFTGKSTKSHGSYSATMECECGWMWKNNEDNTQLQYAIYSRARYSSANATSYGVETHAYMDHMSSDNVATGVLNYGNWVADTGWCYSNWIPRTHETQYVEIWALAKGKTVSGYGAAPEDTGWFKYTDYIGPLASWTVSYDANGGSGAPASQTKWLGEPLTLQSSTPSWEGHTFNGWNTKADGTGTNYAVGASYTGNAALDLYAKWTVNTYQVTFDANGGLGAPATQPKTHGVNLTISATKPTRTNYKFLGWATSASATSAQYCTGTNNDQNTSYTTESDITLYAVWELAYVPPKVTNLKCFRCDDSGAAADEGTRCYVSFTYVTDTNISSTNYATVTAKVGSNAATTLVAASAQKKGTNTYAGVLPDTGLSTDSTFTVAVTVTDAQGGSTTVSTILSQAFFTLDVLAEGHGLAIGKPATTAGLLDVGMDANFDGGLTLTDPASWRTALNVDTKGKITDNGNSAKEITVQYSGAGITSATYFCVWGNYAIRAMNAANMLKNIMKGKAVLYNNASGTNGTVTLSQTAANFDHMRIYFQGTRSSVTAKGSVDVYSPNGNTADLHLMFVDGGYAYHYFKTCAISTTSMTVTSGYGWYGNNGSAATTTDQNHIYVTRVEAWNEA